MSGVDALPVVRELAETKLPWDPGPEAEELTARALVEARAQLAKYD